MADHDVDWETCAEDGCGGVRLPTGQECWAHAADADLNAALKQLGKNGLLDARGVPITPKLLERMLAAAPHDDSGRVILTDVRFDGARFQGAAGFFKARFQGVAGFDGVTFQSRAGFLAATFHGFATFDQARFQGPHRVPPGNVPWRRMVLRGDLRA